MERRSPKSPLVAALALLLCGTSYAQTPEVLWSQPFGGSGDAFPGKSIYELDDGGFLYAGSNTPAGSEASNGFLMRTDASGEVQWLRFFGGQQDDTFWHALPLSSGGFLAVGSSQSFGGEGDEGENEFWAVWTDDDGNLTDQATFGRGIFHGVVETSDGGLVAVGFTEEDEEEEEPSAASLMLAAIERDGSLAWFQNPVGVTGEGFWVDQTTDGGFIVAGMRETPGGGHTDGWLIRTNGEGEVLWSRPYDGTGGNDELHAVQQTADGGFIVSGHTRSPGVRDNRTWLVKTDGFGVVEWTRTYGNGVDTEENWTVHQTSDLGYVLGSVRFYWGEEGPETIELAVRRTDPMGNVIWTWTMEDAGALAVRQTSDGGFAVLGATITNIQTGNWNVVLVRLAAEVPVSVEASELPLAFSLDQNYPNPFNPATTISYTLPEHAFVRLAVYDALGREVDSIVQAHREAGAHLVTWRADDLPSGVYLYRLYADDTFVAARKMVVLR